MNKDMLELMHESIYCRQYLPVFHAHIVNITINPADVEKIKSIISSYPHPDRVQLFIQVKEDKIQLYTDAVYNPYYAYYSCISALVTYMEDALFFLLYRDENDEGEIRFVVDRYEIKSGVLHFNRDYTNYEESEEDYFKRVNVKDSPII